jgi:predicted TPR repeat methyltransferase
MGENNPFHHTAARYDRHLSLPVISALRRQEAEVVRDLIVTYAGEHDAALEIGPGTGYYTPLLASRVRHVTAVEDSAQMARLLTARLAQAGLTNVTVLNQDFRRLDPGGFDLVVAIGVLDYIPDPRGFITAMCAAARKAVVFTAPQRGIWGACFAAGNRLRGISVYCHHGPSLAAYAPGWRCAIREVGLKTPFTRGLTLAVALEPDGPS